MSTADGRLAALERQLAVLLDENARRRARVQELERKVGENSSNSIKPPSTDPPGRRVERTNAAPSGRRRGGQPGHKGHRRTLLPLSKVTERWDSGDLSAQRPRCCRGLLVAECHVSRRKVQGLLLHLLGIRVSLGALSESQEIVSDAVDAAVEQARIHALGEPIKHVDATTWSCAGAYRCLWTMAIAAVTVFMFATDGTKARLQAWMSRVRGVLVTERGTQFGFWAMERRRSAGRT